MKIAFGRVESIVRKGENAPHLSHYVLSCLQNFYGFENLGLFGQVLSLSVLLPLHLFIQPKSSVDANVIFHET